MTIRKPVIVDDKNNFTPILDGDSLGIPLSPDKGNAIVQKDNGLYASDGNDTYVKKGKGIDDSLSVGATADTGGATSAIAIGDNAQTPTKTGKPVPAAAIAVGKGASVSMARGVAIGNVAAVIETGGVALGYAARVHTTDGVAVGSQSIVNTTATNAVSLGSKSSTDRAGTVSVGAAGDGGFTRVIINAGAAVEDTDVPNLAQVKELAGNASGGNKYVKTIESSDKPDDAVATGNGAVVIGSGAGVAGGIANIVVVGAKAYSRDEGATVVGNGAGAVGIGATAIGKESSVQGAGAVGVGQQATASERGGIAIGKGTNSLADYAVAIGEGVVSKGNAAIAIGRNLNVANDNAIVLGTGASVTGNGGIAMGQSAKSKFTGQAIGVLSETTGGNATATGYGSTAAQGATATGQSAKATGENSISTGKDSAASAESSIAIGANTKATHKGSIAFGSGTTTVGEFTVSFGSASQLRRLTYVDRATALTDAPNWGQVQDLIQVTELESTKENPVNLNSLTGPMIYRIREGDYSSENQYPYTIVNAPNFANRGATIEVYVHTNGTLQECRVPDAKYERDWKSPYRQRQSWSRVVTQTTALAYELQGMNGAWWTHDSGIFTMNSDTHIFGTAESPKRAMFAALENPLASQSNGNLLGVMFGFSYDKEFSLIYNRRTGTPTGSEPDPTDVFTPAMVSKAFKDNTTLANLATDASNADIITAVNGIINVLRTSGLIK